MISKTRYLLLFLLLVTPWWLAASERSYNVLYIQSNTPQTPWMPDHLKGLQDGFSQAKVKVNIVTEYLDAETWTFTSEKVIMRRFCDRARDRKTDLIITSGDEAFFTLFNCGDSLPHQIPVVFYGIKYPDLSFMKGLPNVCGYTTTPDFNLLLEQAKGTYPEMHEVVCVTDNSFLGKKGLEEFNKGWKKYEETHSCCHLQIYNVQTDVTNKIIASICNSRNNYGRIVVAPKWSDFFSFLGKNSKSPFYSTQCETLTNGVFCAYDADPYEIARMAGTRAGKVLLGKKISDLGISPIQLDFIYDHKQLGFFHVDKDRVKGGVIINVPFMDRYQWWFVMLYAFLLALFIVVVGWLMRANRKEARRRMHAQTRLLVQNRLVAQRDEFDNIFHSLRDGVITYDTDLRIHFTNRSLHRMLHLPENTANRPYEGMMVGAIFRIYNNGQEILPNMLKQVLKKEMRLVIPDNSFAQEVHSGNYFPVSGEMVPLYMNGKVSGVALSFRNVSDEEMNKRFFNLAIEESAIYPWQFNVRTGLFTFPMSYVRLSGLEGEVITKEIMESRVHPEDLFEVQRLFGEVLSGLSPRSRMIYRQRNLNDKYEWWEYRISALDGMTDDSPYNILGVCQSIQRYKDTEEELTKARDKALQADKLKTAFLANMSHEIRTPLNAIVGFSDLLSDTSDFSQEEISNFIHTINRNCGLLLALINDILDLSRIESGTMDFQFASHSIPLLLKEVYSSQLLNMPPNVKLMLDLPDGNKKFIQTDNVRLQQVINNLINNAAKFTSSGTISFGFTDEEGFTTIFVEDTGRGISEEGINHIFERFYKVDNFTQGAGLGLSICMTIVERLKGTISVASEEGKGTRFTVRLPDSCEL